MKVIWNRKGTNQFICFAEYKGKVILVFNDKNKKTFRAIDFGEDDYFNGTSGSDYGNMFCLED